MVKSGCLRVDFHPSVETLRSQHRHWRPLAGDLKLKKKNLGTSRVKIHWLSSAPHLYVFVKTASDKTIHVSVQCFPRRMGCAPVVSPPWGEEMPWKSTDLHTTYMTIKLRKRILSDEEALQWSEESFCDPSLKIKQPVDMRLSCYWWL